MFDVSCPHCGNRVLLTTRRILSLHNTGEGIVVRFRCWCGQTAAWLTGRSPTEVASPGPSAGDRDLGDGWGGDGSMRVDRPRATAAAHSR